MKTKILKSGLLVLLSIFSIAGFGQEAKKIYDPSLDGMKQINDAVATAKASGKHVLIQYGAIGVRGALNSMDSVKPILKYQK
jgi:hypothetical protein